MAVNISFFGALFVIFAGFFLIIDTKHHSRQFSPIEDFDYSGEEYKSHKHHHHSGKNDWYYDSEEEYKPHKHQSQKNHESELHSHSNSFSGRSMDLQGRYASKPKPLQTTEQAKAEGLKVHNELRAKHGVPPLALDEDLCDLADQWAQEIGDGSDAVRKIVLSHTPELTMYGGVGDNIFACKCHDLTAERAIRRWYAESAKYDYNKPHYHWTWGHFSQVVWKESNKLGMGRYKSPIYGFVVVVATYTPRGNRNYTVSFKENVLPPIVNGQKPATPVILADDPGVSNNLEAAQNMPNSGNEPDET